MGTQTTSKSEFQQTQPIDDFLIARGGPFYELQLRLGLLRETSLRAGWRAALFVAIAWGVPLVLSVLIGTSWGILADRPYLLDPGPWARFFIAIGIFTLTESMLERRLRWCLREFVRAPILAPKEIHSAATAVNQSLKRLDSRFAELIMVGLAFAIAVYVLANGPSSGSSIWMKEVSSDGTTSWSTAGWWACLISVPAFWFLFFRGLWRHLVWSMLLRRIAGMELRLVVSHPDGYGGLGFVGRYPNAYALFVFGVSSVVGAAVANQFLVNDMSTTTYGYIMAVWLALVLALFAFPLSAFVSALSELKTKTMLVAGAQATRYHRSNERKLLGENVASPDAGESSSENEGDTDSSKYFELAGKLHTFLVSRSTLLPVCLAALAPLVLAGAIKLPLKEIISIAKKLLML